MAEGGPAKKGGIGKPDIATIGGLLLATGGILGGLLLEGGNIKDVAQVTAAMIVMGGTLGISAPVPLSSSISPTSDLQPLAWWPKIVVELPYTIAYGELRTIAERLAAWFVRRRWARAWAAAPNPVATVKRIFEGRRRSQPNRPPVKRSCSAELRQPPGAPPFLYRRRLRR
jgi:hypothetical protein